MVLHALFTWRWGDTRRNNSSISKVSRVTVQDDTGAVMLDAYTWYVWIVIASEIFQRTFSTSEQRTSIQNSRGRSMVDVCCLTPIF
jgi:hypothetical protein